MIIINYCIISVNVCYVINAQYNYYISNESLVEECDKEEDVSVTGAVSTSYLKQKTVKHVIRSDVWLTVHRNSAWISKTNQMSLFVFFISLLIVAQHVSGNHVPIIRS